MECYAGNRIYEKADVLLCLLQLGAVIHVADPGTNCPTKPTGRSSTRGPISTWGPAKSGPDDRNGRKWRLNSERRLLELNL
jgi:hypothetical protein